MKSGWRLSLLPGTAWIACFYVAPLALIIAASVATPDIIGRPIFGFDISNFAMVFQPTYLPVVLRTFAYASIATVLCLLIGYPCAYAISRYGGRYKAALLLAVLVPFLADYLIRIYAWVQLLGREGPVNRLLTALGLEPMNLIGNPYALNLGLVYSFAPFMILAVFLAVERLDWRLVEAAHDLHATAARAFATIVIPRTLGGIVAGCQLVFLLSLGDFAVAQFLGGSTYMMGNLIRDQLATAGSLPFGAALTVTLLSGMLAFIGLGWLLAAGARGLLRVRRERGRHA
ncbi:ABC transporter permease [Mycobacterium sp. ACS4331]|uniref:ABC transporter permease n=1 Tax=Mycobacterium sp. ACS4331 TaxID=1834121 RepID=UPI0007FFEE1F|nr:ABC transporter permease [Mycobacterium sp. ACS4331]OBF25532.1 ABC transporter permease [Mycobacterium sp. ACS4331]